MRRWLLAYGLVVLTGLSGALLAGNAGGEAREPGLPPDDEPFYVDPPKVPAMKIRTGVFASLSETAAATDSAPAVWPRITTTRVTLPERLTDTRLGLAAALDGIVWVAWPTAEDIHVTPLGTDLERAEADAVVPEVGEVGGLVVHDDGFALLARGPDDKAYLIRYHGSEPAFVTGLTGPNDTVSTGSSALTWNGRRYGAYFVVQDGEGRLADKLAYVGGAGRRLGGGWEREPCQAGYCGAVLGGVVKNRAGRYAVAYSTRGAQPSRYATRQVAVAFLKDRSTMDGRPVYLTRDRETDHVNVRIAPYGTDRFLVSWQSVADPVCRDGGCTGGRLTGTHFRLIDAKGRFASRDVVGDRHVAGGIAVLPDGDLVWVSAATARTLLVHRLHQE